MGRKARHRPRKSLQTWRCECGWSPSARFEGSAAYRQVSHHVETAKLTVEVSEGYTVTFNE